MSKPLDCGNSPCFFAVPPLQGVRTRGSCRCMRHLLPELSPSRQREVGDIIRATIAAHTMDDPRLCVVECFGCGDVLNPEAIPPAGCEVAVRYSVCDRCGNARRVREEARRVTARQDSTFRKLGDEGGGMRVGLGRCQLPNCGRQANHLGPCRP